MPTENRPVTACHYTKGNYRGRHEWEATGKVVGFGPQTTVYAPKVDANSDPIDTGRAVFVKEGKADMHYPDKTTLHVDPSPEDAATMRGTGKLARVGQWREPKVQEAKVETFNPWQTSSKSQFVDPATLGLPPKEPNKPRFMKTTLTSVGIAGGNINFVVK
eukprot:m.184243 g.184243  ORF g.184243 m.184243 type:complete len:161 (-) comp16080_c0_seq1:198-680(-)